MNIRRVLVVTLVIVGLVSITVGHEPSDLGYLTPLLPITAITGHSGLLTAGLTGAALLKLKAAGALLYWLSKRKHKRAHKGQGWKIEVHKHKHIKHHHRKRRAVEEKEAQKTPPVVDKVTPVDMTEFDPSLDEVLQYDQLGCGMRLVCDLSASPEHSLMEDEKLILQLFGRDGRVRNPEKASRGKLSYSYAALLGSHSRDNKVCSNVYGRCPYSGSEIMYSLRDVTV